MSFDWSKRQLNVGQHEHVDSQLLSEATGETITPVRTRSVSLTNAQIRALPTTPIEIVPAPGEGQRIMWLSALVTLNSSAGAYSFGVDARWQLVYIDEFSNEASGFLVPPISANVMSAQFPPLASFSDAVETDGYLWWGIQVADNDNKALGIGDIYNGVSDYTGGNSANSLTVTVSYIVVSA